MAEVAFELEEARLEHVPAQEVIAWALERFGSRIAISVAGGSEGLALVDMAVAIDPAVRVFTIDTGKLHDETHEVFAAVEARYGITIERIHPRPVDVEKMEASFGPDLMFQGVNLRALCCQIRKVLPLDRALEDLDAWMTGIRRGQASTRAGTAKVERDEEHGGITKVNPIADWTKEQVADYVAAHGVPQHPLLSQGYASIGCLPCTRPIEEGEDERAGRWWWEADAPKECGLHARPAGALDFELDAVLGEDHG